MDSLSNEKIDTLRHNARSVVRELGLLNDAYCEIGVTLAERHLLIELTSCSCPTMGEIAERLLLDKSTVSRLIARAIKKGYIQSSLDEKDKRKRYLHLTELGQETLEAFEPIAFNQTKQALLTLSPEEIAKVQQGVFLYAKGLKSSRLIVLGAQSVPKGQNIETVTLRDNILLGPFRQEDEKPLYEIFKSVVDSGDEFPYESNSYQEFHRQFFAPKSEVFVCRTIDGEVIGGFFIRPNYSGRCAHIANAAYMLKESHRGQGIGTLIVKASLAFAKRLGFEAMQFNMVLSRNDIAIKLYHKLGFQMVGTIPGGVRNLDGTYQDGHIFYRKLEG